MMLPMICFTTAANGIFAALIIAAFKLTSHGVTDEFVLNLFFYVIITSILTVTLMKIAYAGESQMLVDDAVNRMYSILETEPKNLLRQRTVKLQRTHLSSLTMRCLLMTMQRATLLTE